MNCPDWEERIAAADGAAEDAGVAAHLARCASCARFAAALAEDAERLRAEPPEAAEVDYRAMRCAVRSQIVRRRRVRGVAAVLALAASIMLAVDVAKVSKAPLLPVVQAIRLPEPPLYQTPTYPAKPVRSRPATSPNLDRQFEAFLRARNPRPEAVPPPRIPTANPNVTIIWMEETQGDSRE